MPPPAPEIRIPRFLKASGRRGFRGAGFGLRTRPFVGLLFGLRFRHTISLLNATDQLILLAGDGFPVIIGEFPPALTAGTEELLPLAFDLVPIHVVSSADDTFQNEFALARLPPFEFARFLSPIGSRFPDKLAFPKATFAPGCAVGHGTSAFRRSPALGPVRAQTPGMPPSHRERHRTDRVGWLRAAV